MLREYQLTNFKAFAGPETIPIRPITLIYGPNSSGKSSILQSLLLLKQTLEEADSSTVLLPKGKLVDLGDYHEFVHRHEVSKRFSFKVFFTLDPEKIDSEWVKKLLQTTDPALAGLNVDFVYDEETQAIRFSSVDVFIGDKVLPAISYSPSIFEKGAVPAIQINREHSFWRSWWNVTKEHFEEELITRSSDVELVSYKGIEHAPFKRVLKDLRNYPFDKAVEDLQEENTWWRIGYQNFLPTGRSSLPDEFLRELKALIEKTAQAQRDQSSSPADSLEEQSTEDSSPFAAELFYFSTSGQEPFRQGLDVSPVAFQVCSVFRQLIKNMIYLGPLRSYPERYYTFSGTRSEQVGQFGERLPDVLFQNRDEILKRVNAEFDRFRLEYKLELSILRDENSGLSNVFTLRILDKGTDVSASIRDVGFGVSQVLPIIVQSLLSQDKTLLIEQPEIHLHPALQAELGDLFIQAALSEQQNTFLLETHSEHLLLRIMRRMRDTANGTLPAGLPPVRPEDVSIIYVQRKDSASIVRVLELDREGQLLDPWPGGFFEEGFRERFS